MKLEIGKIFQYDCEPEWNARGIPSSCHSSCTAIYSINCPNTRRHPDFLRHFSTSADAMIHSTRGERDREKCFPCYLGIEAARGETRRQPEAQLSASALCVCLGYADVIESRWPGILIAIFGHTYLALQMQSFSAWRAVVMASAAWENVFQLGDFFETRVANIFHHSRLFHLDSFDFQ